MVYPSTDGTNPAAYGREVKTHNYLLYIRSNALTTTQPNHLGYGIRIVIDRGQAWLTAVPVINDSELQVVHIQDIPSVTKQ